MKKRDKTRRVSIDMLTRGGEALTLDGNLFTGVAFERNADRTIQSLEVQDGVIVGEYRSPYYPMSDETLQIDISGFEPPDEGELEQPTIVEGISYEGDDEQLFFHNTPFSGVAYAFHETHGVCMREYGYEKGNEILLASWDLLGAPLQVYLHGVPWQLYSWYRDGTMKSVSIIAGVSVRSTSQAAFELGLEFTEPGLVRYIKLSVGWIEGLGRWGREAIHSPIRELQDFRELRADRRIVFRGSGIDDLLFVELATHAVLAETEELCFFKPNIGPESVEALRFLPRLRQINLVLNNEEGKEIAQRIKEKYPQVTLTNTLPGEGTG